MSVHFSSNSNEWTTPKDFYEKYNSIYNFQVDAACDSTNKLCDKGYCIDLGIDALLQDWHKENGYIWCNPPYGRQIGKFIKKAYEEYSKGAKIVMLIPSRTDTTYWHNYIFGSGAKIEFIKGRLKFGSGENSAPFPSAIIIYD